MMLLLLPAMLMPNVEKLVIENPRMVLPLAVTASPVLAGPSI
jgi:hypothetical protein